MAVRYPVEYECGIRLGAALARIEAEKHVEDMRKATYAGAYGDAMSRFEAAAAIESKILSKIDATPLAYKLALPPA